MRDVLYGCFESEDLYLYLMPKIMLAFLKTQAYKMTFFINNRVISISKKFRPKVKIYTCLFSSRIVGCSHFVILGD